ncbi:MAG: ATP-binding protein [Ignavibacteriales bacterium CG12_big_fil_rev_8_21_14_0_65_30_8]|nr:MAG: ATP-binding protein [Ignavibacteriales bacterium CG12_big_fil_rev_8_21_14_0_65_30_8]
MLHNLSEKKYHLEIESDPNNLITIEEFVNYFAMDLNLGEEKLSALLLSVTEAVTNAIKHGNKGDKSKIVTIDVNVLSETLQIIVKDQGQGFDPSLVPDPTEPDNLLKDSGRGLYLMKVYMSDLRFNITPDGTEAIIELKI